MKEWLQLRSLFSSRQQQVGSIVLIFMVLVLALGWLVFHPKKQMALPQGSEQIIMQHLKELEVTLQQISQLVKTSDQSAESATKATVGQLQNIQADMATISKHNNVHEIQTLLTKESQALAQQLNVLQTQMAQVKKQVTPADYLPATTLPFKVIGIDIWNGEPQATIKLQDKADLMAKNDTRAGWTLVDLTFEPAQAIFKNVRNQLVKVVLN